MVILIGVPLAIISFVHDKLLTMWQSDDDEWLPVAYRHKVWDALFDLDAASQVSDLIDIGAIKAEGSALWYVTVTVNNVEPCGAVTCFFSEGDCFSLDYREYNP